MDDRSPVSGDGPGQGSPASPHARVARGDAETCGRAMLFALLTAVLLYLVAWVYAISVDRHLYLDAAYHLFRIETERGLLSFWGRFSEELFRTRAFAVWLPQTPGVIASDLFGLSGKALSIVYGAGLLAGKLAPLALLAWLTRPEARTYLLFPLGALWVGTASADLILISEGHITSTLVWLPLFYSLGLLRATPASAWVGVGASVALVLSYESMAVLGLLLAATSIHSAFGSRIPPLAGEGRGRSTLVVIALLALVASLVSFASVLVPRDASNRDSAFNALFAVLQDFASGRAPGVPLVALLLFVSLLAILILVGRAPLSRSARAWLEAGAGTLVTLAAIAFVSRFPVSQVAYGAYGARMYSLLLIPFAFALALVALRLVLPDLRTPGRFDGFVRAAGLSIAATGIFQATLSAELTTAWIRDTANMELAVSRETGLVSCRELFGASMPASDSAGVMVCNWSIPALSLLLHGKGAQSIMVDPSATYLPIDTTTEGFRLHIAPRFQLGSQFSARTLSLAQPYQFTSGEWNSPPVMTGFSAPESHGTWTIGDRAEVNVCMGETTGTAKGLAVTFMVFLTDQHRSQRLRFSLGGRPAAAYIANIDQGPGKVHRVVIPALPQPGSCEILGIDIPDSTSPESLDPFANDPRDLGIALVEIAVSN